LYHSLSLGKKTLAAPLRSTELAAIAAGVSV
jgi:hypothetical protein